jgi:hypothetical protein
MRVARGPAAIIKHQLSSPADVQRAKHKDIKPTIHVKPIIPTTTNKKGRKVTSESERNHRKTERRERLQTLARKFQTEAMKNPEKRSAVLVKEKFRIPSYVPKGAVGADGAAILKPSEMLGPSLAEGSLVSRLSDSDHEDDADGDEDEEGDLFDPSNSTLLNENSMSSSSDPRSTLLTPPLPLNQIERYAMYNRMIEKEVEDQVITQLTLRMGGEPINVVVYWNPRDENLKVNAFCFQGYVHW